MSTEAIGDGKPDAVEPDAGAEPTATAVAEPTVAEPAAAEPTAWATEEPSAWAVAEPSGAEANEVPPPDGDPEAGEAIESAEAREPGKGDGPADSDEPDESDEAESDEGPEGGEVLENDKEYQGYESDEAAAPRRARRWPRVLLALGFIVLAAAIVGGAVAIVGSLTHGFKKPVKITYKTSAVFSLKTGDCFDPRGQQSYTLTPCDSPHQAEVFATFALTGGKWPGDAAVQAKAGSGCTSRLTGYVNPQLAISLSSTYVYPDSVAWQAGTRTVICEVRATSGQLTGSVRGASANAG